MFFADRLHKWAEKFVGDLKRRWWWPLLGVPLTVIWELLKDREITAANNFIDSHANLGWLKSFVLLFQTRGFVPAFLLSMTLALFIILGFVIHAYFATRPKKQTGDLQNAPHIDLIYSLPRLSDAGIHHQIRDEQISLVNTTDRIAYDVEISPIRTSAYVATFDPVPRLSKNEPVNVRVDIRTTPQGSYYSGFEAVCKWEYENSTHSDTTEVRIPLTVRYYDQNKDKQFETLHEIVYESFLCEARSRLVRGVQIVPKT